MSPGRLLAVVPIVLFACACNKSDQPKTSGSRIEITVTENGFEPDHIKVKKDQPVTLVFTRKTDQTCAKQVLFDVTDTEKINKELPLDKPVEIAVTFPKTGEIRYACDMNMITGVISVE